MTTTILTLASSPSVSAKTPIDFQMAAAILDRLGFTLQDLSLEYGNVVIPSGDISHQLYYGSEHSESNLVGYVNIENGIYWVNPENNHFAPEAAALELLDPELVEDARQSIVLHRLVSKDYF